MISETCPPSISLANMSRPNLSVPSKYFDLISYTHTYLNNKVASYPILWNMDNLKLIKKVLILSNAEAFT